jgi:UDP-N-acetylmuramate dehydrogenase
MQQASTPISNLAADPRYDELDARFPGRLRRGVPLAERTSFRIGGAAAILAEVQSASLMAELLAAARELALPCFLLGGGSNLLIDESGIHGLVLVNQMRSQRYDGDLLRIDGGVGFNDTILDVVEHGLGGLEFAAGIPGTLGGAVWGNAGCYGQAIGDFLVEARWIDRRGKIETVGPDAFAFVYRDSKLKRNGAVLLDMVLQLLPGDRARSESIIAENMGLRWQKHPHLEPCAGSYFKNVPPPDPSQRRIPAGRLLEEVGAKSLSVGGAAIFPKHANIIINRGGATASDVRALAAEMKRRVGLQFGIELEEEVTYIPPDLKGCSV